MAESHESNPNIGDPDSLKSEKQSIKKNEIIAKKSKSIRAKMRKLYIKKIRKSSKRLVQKNGSPKVDDAVTCIS